MAENSVSSALTVSPADAALAEAEFCRGKRDRRLFRRAVAVFVFASVLWIEPEEMFGAFVIALFSFLPTSIISGILAERFSRRSNVFSAFVINIQALYNDQLNAVEAASSHWERMTWQDLEFGTAKLLRESGFEVIVTGMTGDGGVDIEAMKDDDILLVQCKKYHKPTGPAAVRDLAGAVSMRPGCRGLLVAPAGFTSGARDTAAASGIELWDLKSLTEKKMAHPIAT